MYFSNIFKTFNNVLDFQLINNKGALLLYHYLLYIILLYLGH